MDGFDTGSYIQSVALSHIRERDVPCVDHIDGYEDTGVEGELPLDLIPVAMDLKKDNENIFYVKTNDHSFIFRLIKEYEFDLYKNFTTRTPDSTEVRRRFFSRCILWSSDDEDDLYAYTLDSVISTIIKYSDFSDLSYFDQLQDGYLSGLKESLVKSVLPWHVIKSANVTKDEYRNMNISQISEHLATISHYSDGKSAIALSQNSPIKV